MSTSRSPVARIDVTLCPRFHRAVELIGRRWTGAIVRREVHGDSRVRVVYRLTESGAQLEPALNEIARWAERWIPES